MKSAQDMKLSIIYFTYHQQRVWTLLISPLYHHYIISPSYHISNKSHHHIISYHIISYHTISHHIISWLVVPTPPKNMKVGWWTSRYTGKLILSCPSHHQPVSQLYHHVEISLISPLNPMKSPFLDAESPTGRHQSNFIGLHGAP